MNIKNNKTKRYAIIVVTIIIVGISVVVFPLIAERYYNISLENIKTNRLDTSLINLNIARKFMPINPLHYQTIGNIYIKKEDIDEAIEAYRKALYFKKEFAPYHIKLGWLYWKRGKFDSAIDEFNKAIILDRYGAYGGEHYSDLGLAYAFIGNYDEAINQFKRAAEVEPEITETKLWQEYNLRSGTILKKLDKTTLEYWIEFRERNKLYDQF